MGSDSTPSFGITSSNRTPNFFSSRLRLAKSPADHNRQQQQQQQQVQLQQKRQPQQTQQTRQDTPLRQRYVNGNYTEQSQATTLSGQRHINTPSGPSQHPSQYPPSAILALQQAGLAVPPSATRTALASKKSSLAEGSKSVSSASRRTSFEASDSGACPSPVLVPGVLNKSHTLTASDRPSSYCSYSSSEFSLSAAFPDEDQLSDLTRPVLAGKSAHARIDHSNQEASRQYLPLSSQRFESSGGATAHTLKLGSPSKLRKVRSVRNKENQGGELRRMGSRTRSKTSGVRVLRRGQPEETGHSRSSPTESSAEGDSQVLLRQRTIALASHTSTQKSPPPQTQLRRAKLTFPPSPVTPRSVARPMKSNRLVPAYSQQASPGSDPTIALGGDKSTNTLGVTRPPRSIRRSPSPLQSVEAAVPSGGYTIEAIEEDEDEPIFDYVDGIKWEMLKNKQAGIKLKNESPNQKQNLNETRLEAERWGSIEQWRSKARQTSDDIIACLSQRQDWDDEPWDSTVRPRNDSSSSNNLPQFTTMLNLPSAKSDISLTTAQSFQSLSSMGPLVFTAMADLPKSPPKQKNNRPSTSPETATFSPLPTPNWDSRLNPSPGDALSNLPGTFPGFQSSHSLVSQQSKRPATSTAACEDYKYMFQEGTSSSRLQHCPNEAYYRSPSRTNISHPSSEIFESADEGAAASGSSPIPFKSPNMSPRTNLLKQHNAQKRASRLFGFTEKTLGKGEMLMDDEEIRGHSPFGLTAAQLMALSEEAESGLLGPAELREKHEHLLTNEDDSNKKNDHSFGSYPTPELWRQSHTSKEDESLTTPVSGSWEGATGLKNEEKPAKMGDEFADPLFGNDFSGGGEVRINSREPKIAAHVQLQALPQPLRPIARRKSKRLSSYRGAIGEEPLSKPITATFVKLSSLPIQLVDAPVQISWKSSLSAQEYDEFASTFGSKEMHRQEVIEELSITEWNFVANLNSILRVFSLPLRNPDLSFTEDVALEVARLFNWLDDILSFHVKLLKSLDKVKSRHPSALVVSIAGSIQKQITGLSIHQSYLVNLEQVTKIIDDVRRSENKGDLANFDYIIERQSRLLECRGMGLGSFLLKPVQRLMKYPLFFKQLAELTPVDHPDYQDTQKLCSFTEKIIRDMNCVKAREEDYQELKLLESRIKGLPEDFHLAFRQRRLFKQGPLRNLPFYESDRSMTSCNNNTSNPFDRSFGSASPTLSSSVHIRPLGLAGSGASVNSPPPRSGFDSPNVASHRSPTLSDTSFSGTHFDAKTTSFQSAMSSATMMNSSTVASDVKKNSSSAAAAASAAAHPPLRPASRKTSMANLFARSHNSNNQGQGKQAGNEVEEELSMHAFVFDDLLLLTIADKEEEKETVVKGMGKQGRSKKKQASLGLQASPTMSQLGDDGMRLTMLPKGGLSRILGVSSRSMMRGTSSSMVNILEVEVLPLMMASGDGSRSSGSGGSMVFLFNFPDEVKGGGGGAANGQELCGLWEKAMERSFLSCIQARKKQSKNTQPDLSSPIFGALTKSRTNQSVNTAQADWPKRQEHVTSVVMNAARCGDRTTLNALLQAGLPFPRSPSQQNLSDLANRTVAIVESNVSSRSERMLPSLSPHAPPPPPPPQSQPMIHKSPSQSQLQTSLIKRSPILGISLGVGQLNISEVARVGDLGNSTAATRILEEERREEKTWWSLRQKEIEAESERMEELEKLINSRRSRVESSSLAEPLPSSNHTLATRVRKGLPVLKQMGGGTS